ncbi:MAG: hypothetical protein WA130_08545 [Candidatus Methanoperedens sp.]
MQNPEKNTECYEESWDSFGSNVKKHILGKLEEFEKNDFDLIIGFTRGGAILALTISCILKDNIKTYDTPLKASVRTIPKGIVCKRYDPCFIMNQPTSDHEKKDITKYLKDDLENFYKIKPNKELLNLLVVDDNLSGATRMKYLVRFLKTLLFVKSIKMLAYVRHPEFIDPPIPTIREFPSNKTYFSMPWHKTHEKRDLVFDVDEDTTKVRIHLKFSKDIDFDKLFQDLSDDYYIKKTYLFKGAKIYRIENGASELRIEKRNEFLYLDYILHMFYPPKECLKVLGESNNNCKAFGDKSICALGTKKTKATCSVCSILNCNSSFIIKIINFDNNQPIVSFNNVDSRNTNETLIPAIKNWFEISIPNLKSEND